MQFGGLLVLAAVTALALATRYYLKSGTNFERSYFFQSIEKKKFDQIVIDLIYTNYLSDVFLKYTGLPLDIQPYMELWIRFYVGFKMKKKLYICECTETSKSCNCNIGNYVRLITIKAKFAIENMTMKGYEVLWEYYVGCFGARNDSRELHFKSRTLQECMSGCAKTNMFGVNSEGLCMCIGNITAQVVPVNVNLCSAKCPISHQLCGGENYFSVYSKSIGEQYSATLSTPTQDCIFEDEDCQHCATGSKGMLCELRDCSDHNGNCQDKECQSLLWENIYYAVCICSAGYYIDSDFFCHDIDECNDGNKCDTSSTMCVNEVGSYSCTCLIGYSTPRKDASSHLIECHDNDECAGDNMCHESTTYCRNNPGSYTCRCLSGFKYLDNLQCDDVDECAALAHICGKESSCINTFGSFECDCPPGSVKTVFQYAVECNDRDECLDENKCDAKVSICLNTRFSYFCLCHKGFVNVDEFSCEIAPPSNITTGDYHDSYTTDANLNDTLDHRFENYIIGFFVFGVFMVLCFILGCGRFLVICLKDTGVIGSSSASTAESPRSEVVTI